MPTWEVVLGQTGRLGNYTAGGTCLGLCGPVCGQQGRPAGRQVRRDLAYGMAWQAHNNDAGLARPSWPAASALHVHAPVVVLFGLCTDCYLDMYIPAARAAYLP